MWNRYRRTADFTDGKPWVLRFFDQIRFFPVTADELRQLREEFPPGRYRLKVEETVFRLQDYNRFLRENAASIAAFKATQQVAFEAERWRVAGQSEGDCRVCGPARSICFSLAPFASLALRGL
jgi:urea carboxylase